MAAFQQVIEVGSTRVGVVASSHLGQIESCIISFAQIFEHFIVLLHTVFSEQEFPAASHCRKYAMPLPVNFVLKLSVIVAFFCIGLGTFFFYDSCSPGSRGKPMSSGRATFWTSLSSRASSR